MKSQDLSHGTHEFPALTGLRAIAAYLVCWFHISVATGASEGAFGRIGYTGVSIFFVLSGFLIAYRYASSATLTKDWLIPYFQRRVARILPVYWLLLTLVVLLKLKRGDSLSLEYLFYSMSVGQVARFLVLNSDNKKNVDAQMAWAERELKAAQEAMVFLVYHHPTYSLSPMHKWTERKDFQLKVRQLIHLHRKKIAAILVGHDHFAQLVNFGDLPAVLSGASWEIRKPEPVDYVEDGVHVQTQWLSGRSPHWVKLSIDPATREVGLHFVRAQDDKHLCSALMVSGKPAMLAPTCARLR